MRESKYNCRKLKGKEKKNENKNGKISKEINDTTKIYGTMWHTYTISFLWKTPRVSQEIPVVNKSEKGRKHNPLETVEKEEENHSEIVRNMNKILNWEYFTLFFFFCL